MKVLTWLYKAFIVSCVFSVGTGSARSQGSSRELRFERLLSKEGADKDPVELLNEANILFNKLDYAHAESLFRQALTIIEKTKNPDDAQVATVLVAIGNCLRGQERFAEVEPLIERAIAIQEKRLGPDHPDVAEQLSNLAWIYVEEGAYARAQPILSRALKSLEKNLGSDQRDVAFALANLAGCYQRQGLYADAEPLLKRALAIHERVLGPEDIEYAGTLENLAELYYLQAQFRLGSPLILRAVAIWGKHISNEHPEPALAAMNRLALLLAKTGDYAEAEMILKRVIATAEDTLTPNHLLVSSSLHNLAFVYYNQGQTSKAKTSLEQATAMTTMHLQGVLVSYCERDRLTFQKQNLSFDLPAVLFDPQTMADCILHFKGSVLDSLVQDRKLSANAPFGEGRKELNELLRLKSQLSRVDVNAGAQKATTEIKDKIASLEIALGKRKLDVDKYGGRTSLSVQEVLPLIPAGTVLIDFVSYNTYSQDHKSKTSYGFSSLSPSGGVHWTKIEQGEEINQAITKYRGAIKTGDETALLANLRLLYEKLWIAIEAVLPSGTKTVIISPDSLLNFLSFACLLDQSERFIGEKYLIYYVGSGRDLVPQADIQPLNNFVCFANPVFESNLTNATAYTPRSTYMAQYAGVTLPPLPGTQAESIHIRNIAETMRWTTQGAIGTEATEKAVRSLNSPTILHLATHGFYLSENFSEADGSRGMHIAGIGVSADMHPVVSDPMRLSGIALAGAQNTLRSWAKGQAPDPSDDGILTAEEVASLDLNATWLVTLSACSTGVGEVRSGEGVFGLRRAFMMAGARNLLMTLWPVADESTADFMASFYTTVFKNGEAARSLAETQRKWLVDLRLKKGLLTAVRDAGPFVLATSDLSVLPLRYEDMLAGAERGEASSQLALGIMFQEGRWVKKSDVEALKWYHKAAEQNVARAESALGAMYLNGQGVIQNSEEALKWFSKAAGKNDPRGNNGLGVAYDTGQGVKKDKAEAMKWYRKAAEQDYAKSQYLIGLMYLQGDGVQKDKDEAMKWLRRSAEQKFSPAQFMLGHEYLKNISVDNNTTNKAMHWLWLAACQNDANAQYELGVLYEGGRGLRQDNPKAYSMFKLSEANGNENATLDLASLAKKMPAPEILEGAKLADQLADEIKKISSWISILTASGGR